MSGIAIRSAEPGDRGAIRALVERAFGQPAEADLVEALVARGDHVLEGVALEDGRIVGHVLFSRLGVEGAPTAAVALAPLAVDPDRQGRGIGAALVRDAHDRLRAMGETLSVVLGEPGYYGRFGYRRDRAAAFDCEYQCEALLALAWGDAPHTGRLVYAAPFGAL